MSNQPTPEEVLSLTTPQVKSLIAEILKFEKEYQNYRDVSRIESELCDRIVRLIEREVKS